MTPDDTGQDPTARELRERAARTAPAMSVDLDDTLRAGRRRLVRRRTGLGAAAVVVAAAVVLGGAQLAPGLRDRTPPPVAEEPTTSATATPTAEPEVTYHCNDLPVPLEVLTEGRFATELTPESLAILGGMKIHVPREWHTWRVLVESDTEIVLIRPQDDGAAFPSYQVLEVANAPVPGGDGAPQWAFRGSWSCAIMRDLGELDNVDLFLPADGAPDDAETLTVMVMERACTGGADPTERLRLVDVVYTSTTVEVLVGVEPLGAGAFTCIGNTPVPFVIPLDEPVAGRTIVDAAHHPALALPPQGTWGP